MIFCGYPGIGKTSIAGETINGHKIVDMELWRMACPQFPEKTYKIFINYVEDLMSQGLYVMCPTDNGLRKELEKRNIEYVNVFPNLTLKNYWLSLAENRYWRGTNRDLQVYGHIRHFFEENIKELSKHEKTIKIESNNPNIKFVSYGYNVLHKYADFNLDLKKAIETYLNGNFKHIVYYC